MTEYLDKKKIQLSELRDSAAWPQWFKKITEAPADTSIGNRPAFTGLSGGKDSVAMTFAQAMFEPVNTRYLITPTGNELPEMYAHWRHISEILGAPLTPVITQTLPSLIRQQRALPNHRARWCTRMIKLEPYYGFLAKQGPCVSYVGLRADEESRPGMIFPDTDHVEMRFPMRRWGWVLEDVLAFLDFMEITIPDRTDCAMCFWQKLGEWWLLWRDNRDAYMEAEGLEEFVIAERGEVFTLRSKDRDTWPARLRDLRAEFEAGRVPERSLKMMDKQRQIGGCRVCTL